jgi:antitoxin component YwqK of YwqJK toxin-antitoxin module
MNRVGKSLVIDPPKFEGQCVSYYKSGVKESMTNYKNGLAVGSEYHFYPNGRPYLVIEYPDNNDRYNQMNNNFLIMDNLDSLGTVLVEKGNGYYKGYDKEFKYINEEGAM